MTLSPSRVIVAAVALAAAGAAGYAARGFIPSESAGAALRRACTSILDEAAVELDQPQPVHELALRVWMERLAERDPALAPELTAALKRIPLAVENDRESNWRRSLAVERAISGYRKSHPESAVEQEARAREEAWQKGAPARSREEKIRACIVKKGLKTP